ncbi:MAG: 16S rRNA (guanine(966)-N(2))-methyltransferase RsmD [Oscillospiraceae bacterium]|nr:16S rRNA (guanine(966)-N(2))-methyltransferase RsmD [Oscillospiraceae bacterium]
MQIQMGGRIGILRIVSGKFGGRLIRAPEGAPTRPTSQVAREALFSILAPRVAGAVFIDMYAGSGAVGIEALSRGAGCVVFADSSRECVDTIRDNLKLLGIGGRGALVLEADLARGAPAAAALRGALKRLGEVAADIIFADPPYGLEGILDMPRFISESYLCAADGTIIIEHSKKTIMPANSGMYEKARERQYGDSCLSFYESAPDGSQV